MTTEKTSRNTNSGKKGGNFLPALCNILGVGILIFCILIALPLSVPKFLGYDAYQIVSGSMEPAIPVHSVIYVKQTEGADVQVGDVIAFYSGSSVVAHRVEENDITNGKFVTKGDANPREDIQDVHYSDLVGVVKGHIPVIGAFLTIFSSSAGKIYVLIFALCGIMFNILAGRLRNRTNESE